MKIVVNPTHQVIDGMSLVELVDAHQTLKWSRNPEAAGMARLIETEINIRQRAIRERAKTVELANAA